MSLASVKPDAKQPQSNAADVKAAADASRRIARVYHTAQQSLAGLTDDLFALGQAIDRAYSAADSKAGDDAGQAQSAEEWQPPAFPDLKQWMKQQRERERSAASGEPAAKRRRTDGKRGQGAGDANEDDEDAAMEDANAEAAADAKNSDFLERYWRHMKQTKDAQQPWLEETIDKVRTDQDLFKEC